MANIECQPYASHGVRLFTIIISVFISLLLFLSYSFSICYKFLTILFMLFPRNIK